jgi:hypothetical protein
MAEQNRVRYVDDEAESIQSPQGANRVREIQEATPQTVLTNFLVPFNNLFVGLPERLLMESIAALDPSISREGLERYQGPIGQMMGTWTEPQNEQERIANRAGQTFVDNLGAVFPLFSAANITTKVANPSTMDMVRQELFKFVQQHPSGSLFMEQLSAALSGFLGGTAEEAGAGPMGQFGAEVVGGLAPTAYKLLPSAIAVRAFRRFFGQQAEQQAREQVARQFGAALDAQGEQNLQRAMTVFEDLGTTGRPSIAEATGEPSLIAQQRRLERQASGSTLNALARRKQNLSEEIIQAGNFAPERTGNEPDIIFDAVTNDVAIMRREMDDDAFAIQTAQDVLSGQLPRMRSRIPSGMQLRERMISLRRDVKDNFSRRAEEIGLNDPEVVFDYAPLKQSIEDELFDSASIFSNRRKPEIARELRALKRDNITLEDLQTIRTEIGDDLATATFEGNRREKRMLMTLQKVFDDYFDNVDPNNASPDLAQNWRQYRQDYRKEYIERFFTGTAFRIGQRDRQGSYRILDEMIADEFLNTEQGVLDYLRLYGGDDSSLMALRNVVLDRANDAAVRDGVVNRNSLDTFIRNNRSLDQLPAIKSELENISSASQALSDRQAALKQRGLILDRSRLSNVLEGSPEGMVDAVIQSPEIASRVASIARRHGLQNTLNAVVWDRAMGQIDTVPGELPNPAKLLTWINSNERAVTSLIGREHTNNLRLVYEALSIVQRTPMPTGAAESGTPLGAIEEQLGVGVPQISSRYFAAESGRVGYRYVAVDALSRFFNRVASRKQDALLHEALFDPNVARDLANLRRADDIAPAVARRLNGYLFTIGYPNEAQNILDREFRELLEEN